MATRWQTSMVVIDSTDNTFTATVEDPNLIIEEPGKIASNIVVTVTMADDSPLPTAQRWQLTLSALS